MNVIPYGRQNITDEDIEAVVRVLKSDYLTQGPSVGQFEAAFSESVGAKYSVAVANGTAALHIAAITLGVGPGTKVLTTPITFAASANCIRYCGGDVEFIDIDPVTRCIDLEALEAKLSAAPAGTYQGIIPVSLAGYPVDLKRLRAIADRHKTWIVEDACHALGAFNQYSDGERIYSGASTSTEMACFSFHPVKHITTGEGGIITTSSEMMYQRLQRLRTHGITKSPAELPANSAGWYYEMQELGFNYRLTDMQAALGTSQLARLNSNNARRQEIAKRYDVEFAKFPITVPSRPPNGGYHGFHLYIIESDRRRELYDFLRGKNILPQVHYIPVNHMPYYRALGFSPELTPRALKYYERALSLPMFPSLTDSEQGYVIECVAEFFSR